MLWSPDFVCCSGGPTWPVQCGGPTTWSTWPLTSGLWALCLPASRTTRSSSSRASCRLDSAPPTWNKMADLHHLVPPSASAADDDLRPPDSSKLCRHRIQNFILNRSSFSEPAASGPVLLLLLLPLLKRWIWRCSRWKIVFLLKSDGTSTILFQVGGWGGTMTEF